MFSRMAIVFFCCFFQDLRAFPDCKAQSIRRGVRVKAAGAQTGAPIALSFGCPALCCPDQVSTAFGPAFMPQGRA